MRLPKGDIRREDRRWILSLHAVHTCKHELHRGWRDATHATKAQLNYPTGLASDGSVVFIADRGNNCIRKWDGQIDGVVQTVAGNCELGAWGFKDGRGTEARFSGPSKLALGARLELMHGWC